MSWTGICWGWAYQLSYSGWGNGGLAQVGDKAHRWGGQKFEDTTYMLSKRQCSFRKCLSTQHCLLVMRKKWGKSLDKGDICRAILTDILKAFVCIFYDRSITKLATYCFDSESPESWRVFFPIDNKKVNNTFSWYSKFLNRILWGLFLGQFLFNISACDIFFDIIIGAVANFVDNNTLYISYFSLDNVINNLKNLNFLLN